MDQGLIDTAVEATRSPKSGPIQHCFCTLCNKPGDPEAVSLCGQLAGMPKSPVGLPLNPCVVCLGLAPKPCPQCGGPDWTHAEEPNSSTGG